MRFQACLLVLLLTTAGAASAQTISFFFPPDEVGSGLQSSEFVVRLSDAQHGGVIVGLASSDTLVALVAADDESVGGPTAENFVPNGSTDARFVVQGLENLTGTVTLTASAPGFADAFTSVDVVPPALRLLGVPASLDVPDPVDDFYVQVGRPNDTGTSLESVEEARIGGPGLTATFSVSDAVVAELVTTTLTGQTVDVGIVGGESRTPTLVSTGGVGLDGLAAGGVDVTATIPGFVGVDGGVASVQINPAELSFIGLPTNVGAGLRSGQLRTRLNGTAHGGTTVQLVSIDSTRVLLSAAEDDPGQGSLAIFVADGAQDANFWVHGLEGVQGVGPIDASAAGFVGVSEGVEVVVPGMDLQGLPGSIDTLDPPDAFYVRVGVPNASVSGLASVQDVRPGSAGLDVAVISDDPAVGLLETASVTGQDTVWLRIEPNENRTPTQVASGGAAFDGVGPGTVTVRPEITGFTPTTSALREVDVTQPDMDYLGVPDDLGSGLQTGNAYVRLGASQHGGVTVRIEVAEPGLALVTGDEDTVGAAFVEVPVADGDTRADFWLQGLEGATGPVHLTATAPGFTTGVDSFAVVVPSLRIQPGTLGANRDTADPPDPFRARIGVANGSSLTLQALRAGSPGVDVTASVDAPLLGQIYTQSDTSSAISLPLSAGEFSTPTSIANGGFGYTDLGVGSVTVSVSAPGFAPLAGASQIVTTVPASLEITSGGDIGAGLVGSASFVRISGSDHGGTTVTLAVSDPALALVAPDVQTVGQDSIEVFIPDGQTSTTFVPQGLDGVTGTVTVTASAPGLTDAQIVRDVVQPALEIAFLGTALDVTDPDDAFRIRVGLPNGSLSGVSSLQARRPGAPPLDVAVVCTDSTVANLVTLTRTGGSAQVAVAPGQSQSPSTVALGGIALRGVGTGTTLVAATLPGFLATGNATREVDVTQNGIAVLGVPAALGAGLQTGPLVARLNDGSHGGVTMRITTDQPSAVLVSDDAATAGDDTLEIFLSNGLQDAVFHLQALPGANGALTVTATAPGFDPGDRDLQLVTPGVMIALLPDTLDVLDPDDPFVVRVGVPAADGSQLAVTQVLRAGAGPLAASVALDDGALGDLVTNGATADSVTVAIAPGQFESPATVAAGGVALAAVSGGPLTVSAAVDGFTATAAAALLVAITGDLSGAFDVPAVFALRGNRPNPFNPSTRIDFSLRRAGDVRLDVFDVRGRRVRTLVDGHREAGPHSVTWQGRDQRGRTVATGVYLVRLQSADGVRTHKMALVK